MKKIYEFDYNLYEASVVFEVDLDKFTKEMALATLEFFSWDYNEDNDPIDEVMFKYAQEVISHESTDMLFADPVKYFENKEGFGKIDGSIGIKLKRSKGIEFDCIELDCNIIEVNE